MTIKYPLYIHSLFRNRHSDQKSKTLKSATHNLRLVMAESSVTAGLLAIPIMTPFFNSIGLTHEQIAETQMIFTVIMLLLNLPMGYLTDRISRKWANVIGDFAQAFILLAYSYVGSFWGAVTCECLFGLSSALTSGVDQTLLHHFTNKIAKETQKSPAKLFKQKNAKLEEFRQICNFILLALGGPIGAISLRLAIAASGITCLIGGAISLCIKDDSEKLVPVHRNPIKDLRRVIKQAMTNAPLRARILSYAVGREMTHGIIWAATPLFLSAGVPIEIVSFAWAGNAIMAVIGTRLARKHTSQLSDAKTLAFPTILMAISMLTIGINNNIFTIWLYGLMGIVQGWTAATLNPMVQKHAKPSEQTSILSFTKTISGLLYIPTIWAIGFMSDIKLEYATFTTAAIFLPLSLICIQKLKKYA